MSQGGGYNESSAGKLLASVSRREEVEAFGGQPESILLLIDFRNAWVKLPFWRKFILEQFIYNESPPPLVDLDRLQAVIRERREWGEEAHELIQTVQEVIALRRFAGELNRKYDHAPVRLANRVMRAGRCVTCEEPIQLGDEVRFDERAGKTWHSRCWDDSGGG